MSRISINHDSRTPRPKPCPVAQSAPPPQSLPPKSHEPDTAAIEKVADEIVEILFVTGFGEQGDRLRLVQVLRSHRRRTAERDLGGWCRASVKQIVLDKLRLLKTQGQASTERTV
jgi:hypothetical protein